MKEILCFYDRLTFGVMIMANPQNIDFIYKIVIPIVSISAGLLGTFIGYFLGIHKERLNIKWQDKREATKKLYAYLQKCTVELQHGTIPNIEFGELTKDILYNQMSVLPKKIDNKFFELSYYLQNYLNNPENQTDQDLLLLIEKIGTLSLDLKKELS